MATARHLVTQYPTEEDGPGFSKGQTTHEFVLPFLRSLAWDHEAETLRPVWDDQGNSVDLALMIEGTPVGYVAVSPPHALPETHGCTVPEYVREAGAQAFLMTDGASYRVQRVGSDSADADCVLLQFSLQALAEDFGNHCYLPLLLSYWSVRDGRWMQYAEEHMLEMVMNQLGGDPASMTMERLFERAATQFALSESVCKQALMRLALAGTGAVAERYGPEPPDREP